MKHCGICKRELGNPKDPRSVDCGGDCMQCLADCDDLDCVRGIHEVELEELRAEALLLKNALSKACGDDAAVVDAYIDSQRVAA